MLGDERNKDKFNENTSALLLPKIRWKLELTTVCVSIFLEAFWDPDQLKMPHYQQLFRGETKHSL